MPDRPRRRARRHPAPSRPGGSSRRRPGAAGGRRVGDPFAALRVIELVARLERGQRVRLDDLVTALNARHLEWLFDRAVVADVGVALQANWMADYRNASGSCSRTDPTARR